MLYADLQAALAEFDLPLRVSWKKIRARHRQLVRCYHPDKGEQADADKIRRINAAYKVLGDYVGGYSFDFSKAEYLQQFPEERLREQYWSDNPWGDSV